MYNLYTASPCSYCTGQGVYNPGNMYNAYRTSPCPYYVNPQMYNPGYRGQFTNEGNPYTNDLDYNSGFDFSRAAKDDGGINLRDYGPQPFVVNIEEATKQNNNFRTALWTGNHLQLTLMSIGVGEDIGLEIHPNLDQFIRIEEGQGIVMMGDSQYNLNFQRNVYDDFAFIIPAGTWHNLINTGNKPIKLYSIYAPPQHPFGTVHKTKADAEAAE
jgi:mannose-6-phosphate isomerase-like protein (cupin superfamily)